MHKLEIKIEDGVVEYIEDGKVVRLQAEDHAVVQDFEYMARKFAMAHGIKQGMKR